jgi:DNA replication licensing factor MCM4
MAAKEDVIEDLTNSFAPSIFSHNDVKKGILTQLFGGTKAK